MPRDIPLLERWRRFQPDWILVLVGLNVAVYALTLLFTQTTRTTAGSMLGPSLEALFLCGSSAPARILDGEVWRLLTASFLHANLLHLGMNMLVLWQLGPAARHLLGSHSFLNLWVFGALTAALASLGRNVVRFGLDSPILQTYPGSVGASGAVFAVFGFIFLVSRKTPGAGHLARQMTFWLVINLAIGFSVDFIDNAGHIGGFVGGMLFAQLWFRNPRPGASGFLIGSRASLCLAALYLAAILCLPVMIFGPSGRRALALLDIRTIVTEAVYGEIGPRDADDLIEGLDAWARDHEDIEVTPLRDYVALRGRIPDRRPPTELPVADLPIHLRFVDWETDYFRLMGPMAFR